MFAKVEKSRILRVRIIFALVTAVVFVLIILSHFRYTEFSYAPEFSFNEATGEYDTRYYKVGLPAGDYSLTVEYDTKNPISLLMRFGTIDHVGEASLEAGEGALSYDIHLDSNDDDIVYCYTSEDKDLENINLTVKSERPFYNDRIFEAFLFLAAALWMLFFFTSKRFLGASKGEKLLFVLIHLAVAFSSLPLLSDSIFWGADAPAHVMRVEGVKDAVLNGQFPAFVFPYHNNGYGLLGFMYPNLFLYIPAFFRTVGISIPAVFTATYFFFNAATAATSYIAGRIMYEGSAKGAALFTVLYVLCPYRLVNIYTRADLPETISMCFIPLAMAGLWLTICKKEGDVIKAAALLTVGMTGVFNSHIPSSVLILGVALLFALIFVRQILNKRSLIIIVSSVIYTFCLNMHFIIPFIKLYLFGLNTGYYRENAGIRMAGRFSFLELWGIHDFSNGTAWGGLSIIGALCLPVFIAGLWIKRKETSVSRNFMICAGITAALLFLTVPSEFPWDALQKHSFIFPYTSVMEYSFRIMLIVTPLLTMAAVYFLASLGEGKKQYAIKALMIVAAFICIAPGVVNERSSEPFMNVVSGGARDNELREYWPAGVTEGVFNDDMLFWSSENLVLSNYQKDGLNVSFDYNASGEGSEWVAPPVLYYPGYTAEAVTPSGEKYKLGVSQGDYFRAKIDLPALLSGSHVTFRYGGVWYFGIAYIISALSAIAGVVLVIVTCMKRRQESRTDNTAK